MKGSPFSKAVYHLVYIALHQGFFACHSRRSKHVAHDPSHAPVIILGCIDLLPGWVKSGRNFKSRFGTYGLSYDIRNPIQIGPHAKRRLG